QFGDAARIGSAPHGRTARRPVDGARALRCAGSRPASAENGPADTGHAARVFPLSRARGTSDRAAMAANRVLAAVRWAGGIDGAVAASRRDPDDLWAGIGPASRPAAGRDAGG